MPGHACAHHSHCLGVKWECPFFCLSVCLSPTAWTPIVRYTHQHTYKDPQRCDCMSSSDCVYVTYAGVHLPVCVCIESVSADASPICIHCLVRTVSCKSHDAFPGPVQKATADTGLIRSDVPASMHWTTMSTLTGRPHPHKRCPVQSHVSHPNLLTMSDHYSVWGQARCLLKHPLEWIWTRHCVGFVH